MEYLAINRDFIIQETSSGVRRFADCPEQVMKGNDVRVGFPELIGVEDYLTAVLEGRQRSFELKAIGRSANSSPLYFDLYAVDYQDEKSLGQLVIFFEDVTQRMALEQTLVQATNETNLLMSALSVSKQYADKIVASMADALIVTTRSGDIKKVNQAAQYLFEYSEQELINKPISVIIAAENFSVEVFQEYNLSKGEFLKDVEVVCQTKTGKKVAVAFSCSVIQTDTQNSQEFIYIARDMTERQHTQQRLIAQYATARALSQSATLQQAALKVLRGICVSLEWDVGELWMPEEQGTGDKELGTGSSSSPNPNPPYLRCVEIWHRPSVAVPKFIAQTRQTTFAPGVGLPGRVWASRSAHRITDVASDANFVRAKSASLEGLHGAFGVPILSGSEVLGVMAFYSREVQQPDKDLLQSLAVIGDQIGQFIQRKRAEKALKESEERYRDLFENASDLIQSVTIDGHFVYVNRAWRETLGYSEAEIANLRAIDIIHPNCKARCRKIFHTVLSEKKNDQVKAALITKDGRKISVEGSISCKFVDGKPVAIRAMFRDITKRLQAEKALRHQQEQTERLLLNILPEPIANRLKQQPGTIADDFDEVTVLFADIVGFTELSAQRSPTELVEILNTIFSEFDQLAERHGLEKIKTIGDAYMVVGGIPTPQQNHAVAIAHMALDMQAAMVQLCHKTRQNLSIRIGINTGPVVAGVIGKKKFIYDLWGDTVNIASRMESHGLPGMIQVSAATYEHLRDQFFFEERGPIPVKGKGVMTTYFLIGRKDDRQPI